MSQLVTDLKALKDLLADKGNWTQGEFARNAKGGRAAPNSKTAVCWCILGGLQKVTKQMRTAGPGNTLTRYGAGRAALIGAIHGVCPEHFGAVTNVNDTGGYRQVKKLINAAIKAAA